MSLERKRSYVLTFSAPGYSNATFNVNSHVMGGVVVADVLLTGLIGVIVDAATGSWNTLEPNTATVALTKSTAFNDGNPAEIRIQITRSSNLVSVDADSPVTVTVRRR